SAKEEVLAIFSTTDAFVVQKQLGIINLLDIASNQGIPVKLLTPYNSNSNIDKNNEYDDRHTQVNTADINIATKTASPNQLKKNKQYSPDSEKKLESISQLKKTINSRFIEYDMQTRVSVLIVDRKLCLTVELNDNTKDNSNFLTNIGLSTYSNSKPTVSSYVTIFEAIWRQVDLINEIKKSKHKLEYANKKLKISDKKMKEFVNIAAHELRTPLQPIISYNTLAKRGMIDKEEALDVIDQYSKRLQNLSADLLAVGKIESGNLSSNFEKLRIRDLILDTVESVIKSHPELIRGPKKIVVDLNSKDLDSCTISADKQKVTQLLTNLLNNAIKFTEQGDIRLEGNIIYPSNNSSNHSNNKKHKSIQIKISDTGMGIPEDILPKIFEKFVTKGIKVGKDLKQGTGLGLFICRSIVKLHKGKIYAYNNDDKGATFVFELPIQK
ncbi:MAG TPA: HAMP domain-containing sensor histidine kinase, partial [Candidatus Nitrosocosmicus sp.]|nr:HAMP domain-containing sensor histidine kinase [Candidatus Nitrosocosmicus sp.]